MNAPGPRDELKALRKAAHDFLRAAEWQEYGDARWADDKRRVEATVTALCQALKAYRPRGRGSLLKSTMEP